MQSDTQNSTAWLGAVPLGMLVVLVVGLFALTALFFLRRKLNARATPLTVRADGGVAVPLIAAFGGWKGIPWITTTQSNIAPLLVLHETDIEYRIVRLKRRAYTDISNVDVRTAIGTVNVVLEFRDSIKSFAGNTANRDNARNALNMLASKGCPLSTRAQAFLSTTA